MDILLAPIGEKENNTMGYPVLTKKLVDMSDR
jgi:hypothetical protein